MDRKKAIIAEFMSALQETEDLDVAERDLLSTFKIRPAVRKFLIVAFKIERERRFLSQRENVKEVRTT